MQSALHSTGLQSGTSRFFLSMRRGGIASAALALALAVGAGCDRPAPPPPDGMDRPARVISLAPSLTEIVCALGAADSLVGRTSACDYPPDVVARIPSVGGFGDPSIEMLVSLQPSVILDVDLSDATVGHKIKSVGLNRVRIKCTHLDDIPVAIREVGRYVQRDTAADAMSRNLAAEIQTLRKKASQATGRPHVFVEIWNDPLTTAGKGSFLSELIWLAGGQNIGDDVAKDYFQVSSEWVVRRNPDVILCFYMSPAVPARQGVVRRAGWKDVSAVKTSRIYDGFDNNLILRPGPRVLEGIAAIHKCLAPGEEKSP